MSEERNTKERVALWSLAVAVFGTIVTTLAYANDLRLWPGGPEPSTPVPAAPGPLSSAPAPSGVVAPSSLPSAANSSLSTLRAEPARGGPGVTVTFTGGRFEPSESITVSVDVSSPDDLSPNEVALLNGQLHSFYFGADRRGEVTVQYTVLSGQYLRSVQSSSKQRVLPITVTVTALGNKTNRKATGTYVVDSETS